MTQTHNTTNKPISKEAVTTRADLPNHSSNKDTTKEDSNSHSSSSHKNFRDSHTSNSNSSSRVHLPLALVCHHVLVRLQTEMLQLASRYPSPLVAVAPLLLHHLLLLVSQ